MFSAEFPLTTGEALHILDTETQEDQAVLVITKEQQTDEKEIEARVFELRSLVRTMGMPITKTVIVPLRSVHPKTFIGKGKADEIRELADETDSSCIIFEQDLNPSQQRNLEKATEMCVIDRREVILQIFADRASTKEAVLQVNLARLEYSLPRLTRAWTHLSRQRGGTKGTRGEGEKQLEVDRRIALKKIAQTKRELSKVKEHRATQRKQRRSLPVPTGSIVGYTNAGKSSLLNALTNAEVFVENKLFATLDPTTRKVALSGGSEILLTDTVGFIRDLPHDLIEAFSSTLEESLYSDFIILVLDASDNDVYEHYNTTKQVLHDLSVLDKPVITVFNKIDLCLGEKNHNLQKIKAREPHWVEISLKDSTHLDECLNLIEETVYGIYPLDTYEIPHSRYDMIEFLRKHALIRRETYYDTYVELQVQIPGQFKPALQDYQRSAQPQMT